MYMVCASFEVKLCNSGNPVLSLSLFFFNAEALYAPLRENQSAWLDGTKNGRRIDIKFLREIPVNKGN